jgi:hypothetical protein
MGRYKYLIFLLVGMLGLFGCGEALELNVSLETPGNGSSVSSLTPILAWNCNYTDASFRVQVSNDSNFQELILDQSGLVNLSYTIPEGKLSEGQTYYWKVRASKGGQTSNWSATWSFQAPGVPPEPPPPTPPTPPPEPQVGAIVVKATLDGAQWTGDVEYAVSGPQGYSGSAVNQTFSNVPVGSYTVGYSSGGPAGAALSDVTPSSAQSLTAGGTITFTFNFETKAVTRIRVQATLDGDSWTGNVNYTISGPQNFSGSAVNKNFNNVTVGTYTVGYNSGGPAMATLASITPQPTQTAMAGQTATFTLNFHSENTSVIKVRATLDGSRWTGSVNYTLSGPVTDSHGSVDGTFTNMPAGTYTLIYNYGGPSNATLESITPQPTQTVAANKTINFTMNFHSQETVGTIMVNALLDGRPWKTQPGSGPISYCISGPTSDCSSTMPDTFNGVPPGQYTCSYQSGGPIGATFVGVSPHPRQNLPSGGMITFTLNFTSEARGTVIVNATVNGAPWEGSVSYTLVGPYVDSHGSVPYTFDNCPAGSYTVNYRSGGPEGYQLYNITPSPSQNLPSGGTINFTLNFVGLGDGGGLVQ